MAPLNILAPLLVSVLLPVTSAIGKGDLAKISTPTKAKKKTKAKYLLKDLTKRPRSLIRGRTPSPEVSKALQVALNKNTLGTSTRLTTRPIDTPTNKPLKTVIPKYAIPASLGGNRNAKSPKDSTKAQLDQLWANTINATATTEASTPAMKPYT